MISMSLIITLVVGALIFWVLWWGLGMIGLPEPFNKIIKVILIVAVVIFLVNILLGFSGNSFLTGPVFKR